jgi:acyl carrier protein
MLGELRHQGVGLELIQVPHASGFHRKPTHSIRPRDPGFEKPGERLVDQRPYRPQLDNAQRVRQACESGGRIASKTSFLDKRTAKMSTQQETFEIIAKQAKIDIDTIKVESTLKDLGIASLDAIEVIFDLEEHFDVTLPNEDTDFDNGTVGQLVEAIDRQLAAKSAG